jgi:hypothetical protein
LFEDEVVDAVCSHLESAGYTIDEFARATEHGDDIVASHADTSTSVYIEAKGATSSREGSKRYGKPFNRGQVKDHVAKAFYRAVRMKENRDGDNVKVGIALPRNPNHVEMVNAIAQGLSALEIEVFWVDEEKEVTTAGNWT